jgi:hypothetical protein
MAPASFVVTNLNYGLNLNNNNGYGLKVSDALTLDPVLGACSPSLSDYVQPGAGTHLERDAVLGSAGMVVSMKAGPLEPSPSRAPATP